MQKTKLGISVGLLGAIVYLTGLWGGYFTAALLSGYILLAESNAWIKKTSVKMILLMLVFSLISTIIQFIPDVINLISSAVNIWGGYFSIGAITRIVLFLQNALGLIKTVLFLILAAKALHQGTVSTPPIDTLISKNMD